MEVKLPRFPIIINQVVQTKPDSEMPSDVELGFEDTLADKLKYKFLEFASLVPPVLFVAVLIISNGYFFSGFKAFSLTDTNTFIQYGAGAAVEVTTAALLYSAVLARKKGRKDWRASLYQASSLLLFSIVAQFIYLKMELHISAESVTSIPIFGSLVGVGGLSSTDIIYLIRSVGLHAAELFSIFLTIPKGLTLDKTLEIQRKKHEYNSQKSMQDSALAFSASIQSMITSTMAREQARIEEETGRLLKSTTVESVPYIHPVQPVIQAPIPLARLETPDPEPIVTDELPDFSLALLEKAFPSNQQSPSSLAEMSPTTNQNWEES